MLTTLSERRYTFATNTAVGDHAVRKYAIHVAMPPPIGGH